MNRNSYKSGPIFALLLLIYSISCSNEDVKTKPLTFYVIGDWGRRGSNDQVLVANQMNEWTQKQDPNFIITTGDNFYDAGVLSSVDSHWQESFEKVYNGTNLVAKPWHATLGNHDYGGDVDAEIAYSKSSTRWNLPARYYTRVETGEDGTRVRFIFMDTSPFENSYYLTPGFKEKVLTQDSLRQKMWMDSLTSLSDVDWKIVVGHHHIYTGGLRKDEVNSVRKVLEPVFIKNKVDIYFCGHEHDLQHLKSSSGSTHYFLSGAGSELRPTGIINETLFASSVLGFMSVAVRRKSLVVNIVDYNGNVIDSSTIVH